MASVDYPDPVRRLVAQLKQLPGIGPKSAERIAVWLIQS
jgi:recombination protein RecR